MSNVISRLLAACLLAIVYFMSAGSITAVAASSHHSPLSDPAGSAASCKQQAALLNYRSQLLQVYKKSEDKKYQALHQRWAARISYAGQWVPKDAEKTRDSLYGYVSLHAVTAKEVDKQIKAFRYLEKAPLDCTAAKKAALAKALDAAKGLQGKQVVGGNALISQDKQQETTYLKKDFKKSSDSLIKKLHQEKAKHPQPEFPKLSVK
jgi:hypothetical protein